MYHDHTIPLTDWKHRGKPTGRGGSSGSGVAVGHGWNCTRAASFAAPGFAGLKGHVFNPVVFAQGLGCGLLPPLGAPAHASAGTGGTSQVDLRASFTSFTSTGLECRVSRALLRQVSSPVPQAGKPPVTGVPTPTRAPRATDFLSKGEIVYLFAVPGGEVL